MRKKHLRGWLHKRGLSDFSSVVSIDTPYEPAVPSQNSLIDPEMIDAIIVSEETKERAGEINVKRKDKALKPLQVVVVPMVKAGDGVSISSSGVRNGDIDKDGRLLMPENLRETLKKPLGPVVSGKKLDELLKAAKSNTDQKDRLIITIGDVTTKTFLDAGIIPHLSIIDGKVSRQIFLDAIQMLDVLHLPTIHVASGPGFISKEAIGAIMRTGHKVIMVTGEEDLLVLPAILHAPKGSVVYYGQPGEGMVKVRVSDSIRKKIYRLLKKFI